jgi:hypothetical protein
MLSRKAMMNASVERFVKGTLGCECPDEVFVNTEVLGRIVLGGGLTIDAVITVGDRLLVYVLKARPSPALGKDTLRLLKTGRIERDIRNLNRFRLVLYTQDPDSVRPEAEKAYGACAEVDDKMHVHVIDEGAASEFLGTVKPAPL